MLVIASAQLVSALCVSGFWASFSDARDSWEQLPGSLVGLVWIVRRFNLDCRFPPAPPIEKVTIKEATRPAEAIPRGRDRD
jgi:hypothetical protein